MFWTCLAEPLGGNGVAFELGELAAQDQQVEALGVLVVVLEAGGQSGQILGDLIGVLGGQCRPGRPLRILLDQLAVRADEEVVEVHPGDDLVQLPCGVPPQPALGFRTRSLGSFCAVGLVVGVQPGDQPEPGLEQPLGQRLLQRAFRAGQVLAEVLEVAAEVEDEEVLLVLARPEQVGAQPGAAADHLPELRLRADHLEEHEVDDLGYVDAGVEHVDGDRDVRRLVGLGEVVDQALGVGRCRG